MAEYKKKTRSDVDFPNYCLFFIKEIIDSLKEYDINDAGDELQLEIETTKYPYCYDAFELIVKTFKRKGYNVKLPSFKMDKKDDVKTYTYVWDLIKLPNTDDLPF